MPTEINSQAFGELIGEFKIWREEVKALREDLREILHKMRNEDASLHNHFVLISHRVEDLEKATAVQFDALKKENEAKSAMAAALRTRDLKWMAVVSGTLGFTGSQIPKFLSTLLLGA